MRLEEGEELFSPKSLHRSTYDKANLQRLLSNRFLVYKLNAR